MSQHVRKATVQGFIAKITQKIHVLLANKHLKNAGDHKKKHRTVLLTLRLNYECRASLLGSKLPGFFVLNILVCYINYCSYG